MASQLAAVAWNGIIRAVLNSYVKIQIPWSVMVKKSNIKNF